MASHRIGETGLSDTGPSAHHVPYSLLHGINNPNSFINQAGPAFDFGELEEAIVLQGVKMRNDEAKPPQSAMIPKGRGLQWRDASKLETLPITAQKRDFIYSSSRQSSSCSNFGHVPFLAIEIPSEPPVQFHQQGNSRSGGESTDSGSAVNTTISSKAEAPDSPVSRKVSSAAGDHQAVSSQMATDPSAPKPPHDKRRGGGSTSERQGDAKTLRRLAQNREAARKSRLRKKAYVQQLETSRIKLSQLEQDLQRARSQGLFLGACGGAGGNISSGAAMFDMEYARWLEDDHRLMSELRTGLQAHLPDGDLRIIVDGYISHYDEIFRLKGTTAKTDVFHLITGMWTTPAERCFLWMGGFRPSELIKMLITQLDPLTEQQLMGIYSLQQSSQQAEEALSQGLEQLQQSLVDTVAGGQVVDGMQQMAMALGKLANLEGFVRQADNLRQQTLHQLRRILTVRQAARCFLVIGEYYGRLRALSSLWASRPRDAMMNDDNSCQTTDLQMVHATQNHHFSSY